MRIQAAVSRAAARPPAIEALDIEEPRAGEILVRMVASGICHTDINVHVRDRTPKPINRSNTSVMFSPRAAVAALKALWMLKGMLMFNLLTPSTCFLPIGLTPSLA